MSPLHIIITGATGMVGEGVVHECLLHPDVESVLIVNRKPSGLAHPKLKEIVHTDFFDISPISSQLAGYNACFFCLGVSSVGMKEQEYTRLTHTLTFHFAETLSKISPGATFAYISGAGTDSTEKGSSMWARVKGKTENDLMKLPFHQVFAFRPGFIKPTPGLKNTLKLYNYFGWLFPIGRALYPGGFCTLRELGLAMIRATRLPVERKVITGKEIIELARENG